jgi:hypothetical protein
MGWHARKTSAFARLAIAAAALAGCSANTRQADTSVASTPPQIDAQTPQSPSVPVRPPDDLQGRILGRDCTAQLASHALDPIRTKVELERSFSDPLPPNILADQTVATPAEKIAIAKWATHRDRCWQRIEESWLDMPPASADETQFRAKYFSFESDLARQVGVLIAALYADKLTYSEFAQQRADTSIRTAQEIRAWLQARGNHDEQRRTEQERAVVLRYQAWFQGWWIVRRPLVEALRELHFDSVPFEDCSGSGNTWSCQRVEQ